MKIYTTLLLALIPVLGFCEEKEKKVDPVGGREIIELDEGKTYILTSGEWKYQIELTIEKDGYGIAQLSKEGFPPITIISEEGVIQTTRTKKEGNKEISIIDEDGDGLPEGRMTLVTEEGKTKKIILEDLTVHSEIKTERTIDANQAE